MAQSSPQIPTRPMPKHKTGKKPFSDGDQQHDEQFYASIAKKAYELFEGRGSAHGHDVDDWLEAERLVVEELRQGLGQDCP
jgi:hypothetical protein